MNDGRIGQASAIVAADAPRLRWPGAVSLEHGDGWVAPWRCPVDRRALFPPDAFRDRLAMTAGVRVAFHSDTTALAGEAEMIPGYNRTAFRLDLAGDGETIATADVGAGPIRFDFGSLPSGEKRLDLWLPQLAAVRLRHLELSRGASLAPYEDDRPRWITYGSSITHCGGAPGPTETWPALVARRRGLNLTCLGFGSHCDLDPMIAIAIRDRPADYISLCVGINIFTVNPLSPRTFQSMLIGFVRIIRERHPDIPLAAISSIWAPRFEADTNAVGFTMASMREEVAAAVAAPRSCGDANVHYVDGVHLFGPNYADWLADGAHPSAAGYRLLADRFDEVVAAPIFGRAGAGIGQ